MSAQLDLWLREKEPTKAEMAARMKTSRAVVNRLLDASKLSINLNALRKAARALGRKVKIELVTAERREAAVGPFALFKNKVPAKKTVGVVFPDMKERLMPGPPATRTSTINSSARDRSVDCWSRSHP